MNIYFAGSIKGGRQDTALYQELIDYLGRYGKVLTEHIGSSTLSQQGENRLSPQEVYERDVAWVRESDVIVAEVTTPSLGVGYEIGLAESLQKNILCLFRNDTDRSLSSMILGNNNVVIKEYHDLPSAFLIVDEYFKNVVI